MPEETKEVLVQGKEQTGQKLGPNVTYLNPDEDVKIVSVMGIAFKAGESVNVEELLGKQKAQPLLQKLAGNRFFKVDGGPDHAEEQGDPEKLAQMSATSASIIGIERASRLKGEEPPEDYDAPLTEVLEGPSRPRLPGREGAPGQQGREGPPGQQNKVSPPRGNLRPPKSPPDEE